jgi:hypothetical protein
MKTRIAVITVTIVLALQLGLGKEPAKRAVTFEERIELAKKNCVIALHSDNDGVVEASIALVAKITLVSPSIDMKQVRDILNQLMVGHPSASVRYRAYIASTIVADPEWFAQDTSVTTAEGEQFFIAAINRLQQKLFGLNSL